MTKSQSNNEVGDNRSPPLKPQAGALRRGVDQAQTIAAESAPKARRLSVAATVAHAIKRAPPAPATCKQTLWFSFFFDGTGNNLNADIGTLKHSNVTKLFRAHPPNDRERGIYALYVEGVGTYMAAVGDAGGSKLGLGTGDKGQVRLDYALQKFDEYMQPHLQRAQSPANAIIEINIAAFGFSRGAALARAFVNQLLEKKCQPAGKGTWKLKRGGAPLRVRFLGLFDTVASVGLPLSTNSTSKIGTLLSSVKYMLFARLTDTDYMMTRPTVLAFAKGGAGGADPNPGIFDGHKSWGGQMAIPHMVEEVRHFVAAHEIRNSFPLDSVSIIEDGRTSKPAHFFEVVYPGAHSDVGGSYRPGEGGKSDVPNDKVGLIPLIHMYEHAITQSVPLLPKSRWVELNHDDFDTSSDVANLFNHYMGHAGQMGSLGSRFNRHMSLYLAWRFRAIHRKQQGDTSELIRIKSTNAKFAGERVVLRTNINNLEKTYSEKERAVELAQNRKSYILNDGFAMHSATQRLRKADAELREARAARDIAKDNMLSERAKLNALPDMSEFQQRVDMYDKQLLADAQDIREQFRHSTRAGHLTDQAKRAQLRPHYDLLVEAYENEFVHKRGMTDEKIIAFFDRYIHDSLAGFATDATLPSDPRVIYLGGDEKYKYASLPRETNEDDTQLA